MCVEYTQNGNVLGVDDLDIDYIADVVQFYFLHQKQVSMSKMQLRMRSASPTKLPSKLISASPMRVVPTTLMTADMEYDSISNFTHIRAADNGDYAEWVRSLMKFTTLNLKLQIFACGQFS